MTNTYSTRDFFSGKATNIKPIHCEAYGWHEPDFTGKVYEVKRNGKKTYLLPTKVDGLVVIYRMLNGRLICVDWCPQSILCTEYREVLS